LEGDSHYKTFERKAATEGRGEKERKFLRKSVMGTRKKKGLAPGSFPEGGTEGT